ncbi:MAG: spore coat protein CotJB [Oscillospiraceae bacterium]|nr:spore coat protein CotJB [Oscillospiraceae bacterium]
MDIREREQHCGKGRLPARAPLANPYVPFQNESPPQYPHRKGMIRGTMFPGLDLPFKGKVNQREKAVTPLTELQTLGFAVQDLGLYLDTHPHDREVMALYREYQKRYDACAEDYKRKYGPLNRRQVPDTECYQWMTGPWPWEYAKNRGV